MSMSKPKISICVPVHKMENWEFFIKRLFRSVFEQSYKDWELLIAVANEDDEIRTFLHSTELPSEYVPFSIVLGAKGMAANSNAAIKQANGEIVKMLYMDDYLYDENALQHLIDGWRGGWAASGCIHNDGVSAYNAHFPKWAEEVYKGVNLIGSPSVIAFKNDGQTLFDERMSWMLDLDLYRDLYDKYGEPTIINYLDVGIGTHTGQMTHILTDAEKQHEVELFHGKTD